MTSEDLLSQTIQYVRFPLTIAVVFIHCDTGVFQAFYQAGTWIWLSYTIKILSHIIPAICVPLFFFISGYLFFNKSRFSIYIYINKLRSRYHTLMTPYIIWNFIGFLILLIKMHPRFSFLFPSLQGYRIDIVVFLRSFWETNLPKEVNVGGPIDYPLWYVRDLILLIFLSPVIYWLTRKLNICLVILGGIIWFYGGRFHLAFAIFDCQSLFFFPLGAYFSINHLNFLKMINNASWAPFTYIICVLGEAYCETSFNCFWIHKFGILIGMISVFYITSSLLLKQMISVNDYLSNASFFVYALHGLLITKFMNASMLLLQPNSPFVVLLIYFIVPITTIFVCLFLHRMLWRFFPSFSKMITGGR